jgi:CRISPR-associated protein Csm4
VAASPPRWTYKLDPNEECLMPTLTLYHLEPGAAFHLGRRGVEQEVTGLFIPADTLFAALLAAQAEFGDSPQALVERFRPAGPETPAPPFLLTSAFPRAGDVRFYPALPLNRLNISIAGQENRLKELKAIQFISEAIFKKAIAGEPLDEWLPGTGETGPAARGLYLQGSDLWLTAAEVAGLPDPLRLDAPGGRPRPLRAFRHLKVWQVSKAPRVTVDRLTNSSAIYHTGRLHFNRGCGFWFGIAWAQPDRPPGQMGRPARPAVERALSGLADTGLGGERSAGYGHFHWAGAGAVTWPDPRPGQPFVTLSRYHPRPEELPQALQSEAAAYRLVSIAGWLQAPGLAAQRRRRLWMVAEGSIVEAVGGGPWGDMTDVQPIYDRAFPPPAAGYTFPHPVWRYGLACPVLFGANPDL